MAVPDFKAMVSPMDPQPDDVSTTHGFCSVADIKKVFESVHGVLTEHDEATASIVELQKGVIILADQIAVLQRRVEALEP